MSQSAKPRIFVDADACPVKDEVYRVAERYGLHVTLVANAFLRVPRSPMIEMIVVDAGPDEADNWIAECAGPRDVVITSDIPLAGRCLKNGAAVIGSNGRPFTEASIGMALAKREIAEHLRSFGEITGGPKAMDRQAKSRFLSALDEAINRALRS